MSIKIKCVSVDERINPSLQFNLGQVVTLHDKHMMKMVDQTAWFQSSANPLTIRRWLGCKFFEVPGFERCKFVLAGKGRFETTNRCAAIGGVEIDWTRCKRSVRNQARNISKDLLTFGRMEKIARGYKR